MTREAARPGQAVPERSCTGATLSAGQSVASPNGEYFFACQHDGNLVLYDRGGSPMWASDTAGTQPGVVVMQHDGNLVLCDARTPLWSSGTQGYRCLPCRAR
jgi:hypothetical protein